jgi:bifunctional ADP-heptose synthase (sugar kinase/adenylyltransferase)
MLGDDGEGYELRAGLRAGGVQTGFLVESSGCFTPTYIKPMLRENGVERELNRIDIKNRGACPEHVQDEIIQRLRLLSPSVDAVVVADQVQERDYGVITEAVREELAALSKAQASTAFIADSRTHIGLFRNLPIKPNKFEAYRAVRNEEASSVTFEEAVVVGRELQRRNKRPVFLTLSEKGILSFDSHGTYHVPTLRQSGAVDACGAGDSALAGIVLALCGGATAEQAAVVGNLVASITVQQIGVTGTASGEEVLRRFRQAGEQFQPRRIG